MNELVIKVFIGFDPVESVAWHTMAHSILELSKRPIAIVPVNIRNLASVYRRDRDPRQSNEFSIARFLVPYLCGYQGYATYFDCDMLLRTDISTIFDVISDQPDKAVYVVKHSYEAKSAIKYLNTVQYKYPRKNWSSVVLWNCEHPANRIVDPEFVNSTPGLELHGFAWLEDSEIGALDVTWNWLVGEYENPPADIKNIHWTLGGPYFNECKDAAFSREWFREFEKMKSCLQRI